MENNDPTNFQLIDPREQEISKTTCKLNIQALKELGWTPPLYVLLYNQIRYYEDYGKLKLSYSIAGKEALAEQFGVSVKSIDSAYNTLTNKLHLGNWVICDKKVFRNVSKIWVSNVRQKRGSTTEYLSQQESTSLPAGEHISPNRREATPELTDTEIKYKYNIKYIQNAYAYEDEDEFADAHSSSQNAANATSCLDATNPIFSVVNNNDENLAGTAIDLKPHRDTKENRRIYAICNELLKLMNSPVRNVSPAMKAAVKARLDKDGYSEEELKKVAKWSVTQQDKFYRIPQTLFSENVFPSALVEMDNDKPKYTVTRTI